MILNGIYTVQEYSPRTLLKNAECLCRSRGTNLYSIAGIPENSECIPVRRWRRGEKLATALRVLNENRPYPIHGDDLSSLFDFYLEAEKCGLAVEAKALILKTQGEQSLTQIRRLAREAIGCSAFYG